jgi:hypothetical protein
MTQEQKFICVLVQAGSKKQKTIESFLKLFVKEDSIVASTYDPEGFVQSFCKENDIVFAFVKDIEKNFDLVSFSIIVTDDILSAVQTPAQSLLKLTKQNGKQVVALLL